MPKAQLKIRVLAFYLKKKTKNFGYLEYMNSTKDLVFCADYNTFPHKIPLNQLRKITKNPRIVLFMKSY